VPFGAPFAGLSSLPTCSPCCAGRGRQLPSWRDNSRPVSPSLPSSPRCWRASTGAVLLADARSRSEPSANYLRALIELSADAAMPLERQHQKVQDARAHRKRDGGNKPNVTKDESTGYSPHANRKSRIWGHSKKVTFPLSTYPIASFGSPSVEHLQSGRAPSGGGKRRPDHTRHAA
jgi:hypothetical protein